jgi:crotonobetainyl-CoA:carnitine CoA-transferase CaiB-like acyl-CoA transferase
VGALQGIRVVDFGHYVAGPLAALLLADNGADVVHVDPPGGPRPGGAVDAFYSRGKQCVTLDLKRRADLDEAQRLVGRADVVVENFRPGIMERLGLGAAAMVEANPRLVYCSLPGFASEDPRASVAGWEGIVEAATAGYRPIDEHWDHTGRANAVVDDRDRPLFTAIPVASNFAAFLGATCIVMALIARERTGLGQQVEVPLAEAMVEAYSMFLGMPVHRGAPPTAAFPISELSYRCADGRFFDCSPYPHFLRRFIEGAGAAGEWHAAGLLDFDRSPLDADLRARQQQRFRDMMRSRTAAEWETLAIALGLPFAMVRTAKEWVASEQARASQTVVEVDDPEFGPIWTAGLAVHLSETPGEARARTPDCTDPARLLTGVGAARTVPAPHGTALDRPLDGVSVVDVTQVVAGPTTGRLLADFGADVVKINNPVPSFTDGIVGHLHRGKRTMLLDVQDPAGRDVLWRLVEDADVYLQNFAMGSSERYGIGYDDVRARKSDIVYVSISAFAYNGPWGGRRGYENQANAATGLSWRYGGPHGWPLYQPHLVNDAGTGVLGAFATGLGLFHRSRTGRGQHVATSLSQSSTLHQAAYLVSASDGGETEPRGVNAYGWSAVQRLYKASDSWFFLAVGPDGAGSLAGVEGLEGVDVHARSANDTHGALASALADRFALAPVEAWIERLHAAGIGAQAVDTLETAAEALAERGVVYHEPAPRGGTIATPGVGAWLSATPPRAGADPGPLGSQAEEILGSLGLGERISALRAHGVIRLPSDPVPDRTPPTPRHTRPAGPAADGSGAAASPPPSSGSRSHQE